MTYEKTIQYKTNCRNETSFSASPWESVEMELSVNVNTDDSYGSFELYEDQTLGYSGIVYRSTE